jgi:ribosomal protein L20
MIRVKRGNVARKRRKKILKLAKGFRGAHSRLIRTSMAQVMKALAHAYVGRKKRRSMFRKNSISRLNGFLTQNKFLEIHQSVPVTAEEQNNSDKRSTDQFTVKGGAYSQRTVSYNPKIISNTYSKFKSTMRHQTILLNVLVLAQLGILDEPTLATLVQEKS